MRPTETVVLPSAPADRRSRPTQAQIDVLRDWWVEELEDSKASRAPLEKTWSDCLRMYDATPKGETRDVPIPNAPNVEVPIGAIASDSIYSQAIDTIFAVSPLVTVRSAVQNDKRMVRAAKAMQHFINWGSANAWGVRKAADHALLDSTQLGTSVMYIPWIVNRKHTLGRQNIVLSEKAKAYSIATEDFFVPGAAPPDLEDARWCSWRQFLPWSEVTARAKLQDWMIDGIQTTASRGVLGDRRNRLARDRDTGEASRSLYQIFETYALFDINNDGVPEDIVFTYDAGSQQILRVDPNPFDCCRPFQSSVYQPRAHKFYGIGVVEMIKAMEEEITEVHNSRLLNMLLVNTRMWGVKEGTGLETMDVWPNKVVPLPDPARDLVGIQMADVYSSSAQEEMIILQYAEKRTGINDLAQGRGGNLGSRTPGITALSLIQSVNQRFTPAFDQMRGLVAGAVKQCVYRYQERALLNDQAVERKLRRLVGEDADLLLGILRDREFDDAMSLELTASTASVNRDADRQNSIILVQFLGQYYEKLIQLLTIAENPQMPERVRLTALKIVDASAEAVDRTIRQFDLVRDPSSFLVTLDNEVTQSVEREQLPEGDITQFLQAAVQAGVQGGVTPAGTLVQ